MSENAHVRYLEVCLQLYAHNYLTLIHKKTNTNDFEEWKKFMFPPAVLERSFSVIV